MSGKWNIGTMIGPYNCTSSSMSQDHRKLKYKIISDNIKTLVHVVASTKSKLIITHVQEFFYYTTTYRKAWLEKNATIESIYRNWEESYNVLPQWLNVMKETMLGTVFDLKTLNSEKGETQFYHLLWAFYPSIHGFKYCKSVIHADGMWLYDKYKGTLFLAVGQDGNNKTILIAFELVEGETKEG
ncbi:transposase-like protein, putative [Medicago truncatula]|uniref:Transposase-like protein, putative n=1 Tax=Medicago truncatula TaxID=3880 RepID=G8A2J2_MEDTR|nr:transposase-like protein, putative [Medicago truncatula]